MLHANKNRSRLDRRGGAMNQPKPRQPAAHTHWMEATWGSDARFTRCVVLGCEYAEVDGKPTRGPKQRTREYGEPEPVGEMFAPEDMDVARFSRQLEWGK